MRRKRISVAGAGHFLNQTASPDWMRFPQKAGMPSGQAGRLLSALTKSKAWWRIADGKMSRGFLTEGLEILGYP